MPVFSKPVEHAGLFVPAEGEHIHFAGGRASLVPDPGSGQRRPPRCSPLPVVFKKLAACPAAV